MMPLIRSGLEPWMKDDKNILKDDSRQALVLKKRPPEEL
jgi:hypothetical protein